MTTRYAVQSDYPDRVLRGGFWFRPGLQVLRPECLRIVQAKGAFDDPNIRVLGPTETPDDTRVDDATPGHAAVETPSDASLDPGAAGPSNPSELPRRSPSSHGSRKSRKQRRKKR